MLHKRAGKIEEEARSRAVVQLAINSLSSASWRLLGRCSMSWCQRVLLVASKIADRVGITRSVIVNALRKLKCRCGGIHSLGMKGTYQDFEQQIASRS